MRAIVTNIIEKQGAKGQYFNITAEIEGGKKLNFNSFDKVDQVTFGQALADGRLVELKMEKNDKGYDNLVKGSVKFVEPVDASTIKPLTQAGVKEPSPSTAPAPEVKKETAKSDLSYSSWTKEPVKPVVKPVVKSDGKHRSMAMSYAKDAWCAGKIDQEHLLELADFFLSYIEQE